MKKFTLLLFLGFFALIFNSCDKDGEAVSVTYQEATAIYGDLDAVRNQPLNTSVRTVSNPGKVFVGENFILLGDEEQGVHVINNSDISNPQFINFIDIPGNREFFVKGNFLYAESYYDLVKIDVSDLSNVQMVARAENIFQEPMVNDKGETLLGFSFKEISTQVDTDSDLYGQIMEDQSLYYDFARNIIPKSAVPSSFAGNSNEQSGTVNRITHSQDHLYVINANRMAVISDENGSFEQVNSTSSGNLSLPDAMETVFPYKDKLFVGSRTSMNIYDVADPKDPTDVYQFDHATSCDPVLPTDDVAYITLRTADFSDCPGNINALVVLDIENLKSPEEVKEIALESPYGLTVIGNTLFVGEGDNGISIFDVEDRLNPKVIKKDPNLKAFDIIAHPGNANLLLVAGPNGLSQFTFDADLDLSMSSRIDY